MNNRMHALLLYRTPQPTVLFVFVSLFLLFVVLCFGCLFYLCCVLVCSICIFIVLVHMLLMCRWFGVFVFVFPSFPLFGLFEENVFSFLLLAFELGDLFVLLFADFMGFNL